MRVTNFAFASLAFLAFLAVFLPSNLLGAPTLRAEALMGHRNVLGDTLYKAAALNGAALISKTTGWQQGTGTRAQAKSQLVRAAEGNDRLNLIRLKRIGQYVPWKCGSHLGTAPFNPQEFHISEYADVF
eukprot:1148732-Pelagomonas_calceolata.AAC.1